MKKIALALTATIVALAFGVSSADSGECSDHNSLPGSGTEGFSIANEGDVQGGSGSLFICNNGGTVPEPAKGHVEVGGDAAAQKGYVYIDGDAGNNTPADDCADGYVRVHLSNGAPQFSNEPNGSYAANHEKKNADKFVTDTATDCQP